MKDIYSKAPINKTAALVVNQHGCISHEGLTLKQQKDVLCKKYHEVEDKISRFHKKTPERAAIGRQLTRIRNEIIEINRKIGHKKRGELTDYIIKIIKKRMTKTQWNQLLDEAENLKIKELNNSKPVKYKL